MGPLVQAGLSRHWTIEGELGHGGFGRVFAAADAARRAAALKVIWRNPHAERESVYAERLAGVAGVLPLIDAAGVGGTRLIVTPRARRSLAQAMATDADLRRPERVRTLLCDLAGTLAQLAAMEPAVVHRDVTPENILELDGRWVLADFGIAIDDRGPQRHDPHLEAMTPEYTAPERWLAQRSTPAVDVYALGVIGYRLLTGHLPFRAPRLGQAHLSHVAPRLPGRDADLALAIEACLAKQPAARPTAATLQRWLAGR